jgi:hypothetical protein
MKLILSIFTLTLLLAPTTLRAAEPAQPASTPGGKVRLFVLSGQSNMQGVNPDTSFTPVVKQAFPKDDVIVVLQAEGGMAIRRWWKGGADAQPASAAGDLFGKLTTRVKTALAGKTPDSVAFCWMQGERDAKTALSASYEELLNGFIKALRTEWKHPEMAVVIGRLSDHLKGQEHWDAVRTIQEKVASSDPRGAWVDTDDLNGEKNDLHCTQEGFTELGKRFAAKSVELLSKPSK